MKKKSSKYLVKCQLFAIFAKEMTKTRSKWS